MSTAAAVADGSAVRQPHAPKRPASTARGIRANARTLNTAQSLHALLSRTQAMSASGTARTGSGLCAGLLRSSRAIWLAYHAPVQNQPFEVLLSIVLAIGFVLSNIPDDWWRVLGGLAVLGIGGAMVFQVLQLLFQ